MAQTRFREDYRIVGKPGSYQVMEGFGQYRVSKRKFKHKHQARAHINRITGTPRAPQRPAA